MMSDSKTAKRPVLLYIDDSHGNLDALEQIAQRQLPDVKVYLASTADEGMLFAAQRDVDVILVDIGLRAAKDGLGLIRGFRTEKRTAHIPILAIIPPGTDREIVGEALEAGADDWINQLFEPAEVKNRVALMLRLQEAEERLRQAGLDEDKVLESVLSAGGAAFIDAVERNIDGLIVLGSNLKTRFVNSRAAELLGKEARALLGKTLDLPLTGEPLVELELGDANGVIRKVEMRVVETEWEGELAWVVSLRDITEQWCLEDQFRQAQMMDALGQLASSVAHDFKNILHGILGFTDLLRICLDRDSDEYTYLREIEAMVERGGTLTQQLTAFGRRKDLVTTDLDINAFIEEVSDRLRRVVGWDVELDLLLTPDLPLVHVDPAGLELALTHLCANAREAMAEQGSITITTGLVRFNELELRDFPWASTGKYVTVSVDDTGAGMDLELQSRIFEPFFTTKKEEGHTGLGLPIVYGIVTQGQGNIEVLSTPDWGTEVTIYLPTVARDVQAGLRTTPTPPPRGARTVLLAEDDDVVRALTAKVLERAGCNVIQAGDGASARELFDEHADQVVLAVLDVAMPHLDGAELFLQLREIRPDLPVLFVTGHGGDAVEAGFHLDKRTDILEKPFRPPTLIRKIRELLRRE